MRMHILLDLQSDIFLKEFDCCKGCFNLLKREHVIATLKYDIIDSRYIMVDYNTISKYCDSDEKPVDVQTSN